MAFTQAMAARGAAPQTATETQTDAVQKSNVHPYIMDFYEGMCKEINRIIAEENKEHPPCVPEQVISLSYQDEDVALVDDGEIWEVWGGNGGVTHYLVDLKEKNKNSTLCYTTASGVAKVKRKRNRVLISWKGRFSEDTEVVDLGNKSARTECW